MSTALAFCKVQEWPTKFGFLRTIAQSNHIFPDLLLSRSYQRKCDLTGRECQRIKQTAPLSKALNPALFQKHQVIILFSHTCTHSNMHMADVKDRVIPPWLCNIHSWHVCRVLSDSTFLNLLYKHRHMFLNIKLEQGHGKMQEEIPAVFKEPSLCVEWFAIWILECHL